MRLVSSAGPTTLYLRTGLTEVGLKKKKKHLLQFTPVGFAVTLATSPLRDVMDKIDLQRFTIEVEALESESGEWVGSLVDRSRSSGDKDTGASWESVVQDLEIGAKRMECRMENSRLSPESRKDCFVAFPSGK